MTKKKPDRRSPAELDEKALDAIRAGLANGPVLTDVQHQAATHTVRHKLFSIVDRTQL